MESSNEKWLEVESLVRKSQEGDRAAFGELVARFQGSVHAVARSRQRDPNEAAELVQDVFLHAMRKIGQLREPACFGAWLQKITVRVAINRATRRPPLRTAETEMLEQVGPAARTPLDELLHREQGDLVRSAVARLKPIDRDVLTAFYLQGKSLAEIAVEFDLPIGTVKRRLHVARHRLELALTAPRTARPRVPAAATGEAVAAVTPDTVRFRPALLPLGPSAHEPMPLRVARRRKRPRRRQPVPA